MDIFPYLGAECLRAFERLSIPVHIYSFDEKRICWANPPARAMWLARSGTELEERIFTDESEAVRLRLAEYREAFRRGEDRIESWTFYPRGTAATALCRCSGIRIDGQDEAMLVEIRSLSEAELPMSELRAIEALRHTPLMITLFSEQGKVLMRNPAAMASFEQLDQRAASPNRFRAMFADQADAMMLLEEAKRNGSARRNASMAIDGYPVHNIDLTMVRDPATGHRALLVAQKDISMTVEMGRQLAASEDALQSILGLNVLPVVVISADNGLVLEANHAAENLIGKQCLIGRTLEGIFTEPEVYQRCRARILAGGTGNEIVRLLADGKTLAASLAGARIDYQGHDSIVIVITDIDSVQRAADELEAALDSERRTTEAQRRFLAIASHDLRNPLAIIDSAAQRLERGAITISPDQIRSRAARIRTTVQQLLKLLDNTIDRALNNQSAPGYNPQLDDIGKCVEGVAQLFQEEHAGLTITLDLPPLPAVPFDHALIEQALSNLFANSLRYAVGDARVEVRASATSEAVEIQFRDWGMGIPEEEWSRVFSEYVRGSNIDGKPGTGLGLSIVRQAIQLHGGDIEIVRTDGPGTTFRITLPRR